MSVLAPEKIQEQETQNLKDSIIPDYSKHEASLQESLSEMYKHKEIIQELQEKVKMFKEDAEHILDKMGTDEYVYELPNGEFAIMRKRYTTKEKLNKESLAHALHMSVDDIKTPWDISFLTHKGKLTPKMVKDHTEEETKTKKKISKRKTNPLNKKKHKKKSF